MMKVKFYNGRNLVYTVIATSIGNALDFIAGIGIEWTRYKIID